MTLSAADVERVVTAAKTIEESLTILAEYQSMDRAAYRSDQVARDVVERRFVKATEAALDIAKTLVRAESGSVPETNRETMQSLAHAGIIRSEPAEAMAQAASFRNVLAHTYGDVIDHDSVYNALQDLDRYRTFLHDVRSYLNETGAL
ncbi:type VII toxin-antitoxin system HepT family RNase toxin [Halovivax gelatinilyticus]|uniref:type VII toxin-antitoxin system HepT family RNase toxin n=1 Tax=Halovivax gelatinilyticus TaxID=2961597 RepID=UPI0020CA9282|nr:DUF86 domain-containing protein [Halovivax gelatinilyticus]